MGPKIRRPGRPLDTDSNTREALLDSALRLFVDEGILHCNLRRIAMHANTTPAMVNYHFKNKLGLVNAVVNERVRKVIDNVRKNLTATDVPARELLHEVMRAFIKAAAIDPLVPKLVLREVYSEQGALRETFVTSFGKDVSQLLVIAICRAQNEGSIRKDLDPRATAFAFMSLAIYPVLSSPVIPSVLGLPHDTDSMLVQTDRHFDIFMKGVSGQ